MAAEDRSVFLPGGFSTSEHCSGLIPFHYASANSKTHGFIFPRSHPPTLDRGRLKDFTVQLLHLLPGCSEAASVFSPTIKARKIKITTASHVASAGSDAVMLLREPPPSSRLAFC